MRSREAGLVAPARRTGWPAEATAMVFLVLATLAPLMLVQHVSRVDPLTASLQYVVILYASARLARLVGRGQPDWFDLMFWAFGYVWLGLAGLAQRLTGRNPYRMTLAPHDLQLASALTLLGFVGYDVGRHVLGGRLVRRNPVHHRARVLSRERVPLFAVLALVVTPVVVFLLGGVDVLTSTRYERSMLLEHSGLLTGASKYRGGILVTASYTIPLIASVGLVGALQQRPALRRLPAWTVGALLLVVLTLVVGNPVSASRYWVGTIVLSLVFTLTVARTRSGSRLVAVGILFALVVLFPYADRFRYANYVETRGRGLSDLMVSKADYDASVQLVNVITYVHDSGVTGGRQLLGAVLFFVPRQLWADKPGATGPLLTAHVGLVQTNVSSPLWTEAYIDGGYGLVLVVFVALGIFACWLQQRPDDPESWRPLLCSVVAAYSVIMLRGSLLSNMGGLTLLVAFLWILTVRRGRARAAPPPSPSPVRVRARPLAVVGARPTALVPTPGVRSQADS